MIELTGVGGRVSGRRFQLDAAPIRLGRDSASEVVLNEPGVWGRHAVIELTETRTFAVRSEGEALLTVNQQPVRNHPLRSGDVMGLGSVQLRFGIRPARQRSLAGVEMTVWATVAASVLGAGLAMILLGG